MTVKLKLLLAWVVPSVTVRVIVLVPVVAAVGVMVAVQFGADPENTMLAVGTTLVFELVLLIEVLQLSVLSTSEMVKVTAILPSDSIVLFVMLEITGRALVAALSSLVELTDAPVPTAFRATIRK